MCLADYMASYVISSVCEHVLFQGQKLEESECAEKGLVQMLFEE